MKREEWYRNRAKSLYHEEGVIEVDSDARVSTGRDHGAYVEAWVWVSFETTRIRPTTHGHQKERISLRGQPRKCTAQLARRYPKSIEMEKTEY